MHLLGTMDIANTLIDIIIKGWGHILCDTYLPLTPHKYIFYFPDIYFIILISVGITININGGINNNIIIILILVKYLM